MNHICLRRKGAYRTLLILGYLCIYFTDRKNGLWTINVIHYIITQVIIRVT